MKLVVTDPAGENHQEKSLRALGQWRFILWRGALGWGIPMGLWMAFSNLKEEVRTANALHQSVLQRLVSSWVAALVMSMFLGVIVGFLAWRRLTSDVWPGDEPDPESAITRLGSISSNKP